MIIDSVKYYFSRTWGHRLIIFNFSDMEIEEWLAESEQLVKSVEQWIIYGLNQRWLASGYTDSVKDVYIDRQKR